MYAKWNRFLGVFVTPNIGRFCMSKNDPFWTHFGHFFDPFTNKSGGKWGIRGVQKGQKWVKMGQKGVKKGSEIT